MSIEIMNLHHDKPTELWDVRVDRTSPLGNLFHMKGEDTRDYVCYKYEVWFEDKLNVMCHQRIIVEFLRLKVIYEQHGKLRLFCWCAPKRCHAETIKKYIEESCE